LSNFLFVAFFCGWFIIKFTQLVGLLPLLDDWIGDGVFSACDGSGGTITEDLFYDLPLKFFAECSSDSHKTRPP
jgi:hypothetical protein